QLHLRHDYATSLYKANVDIKTAQKLLGHSDIKMTLQIYTHLEQDNKDITSKLNNLFSNDNKPSDSQMIVKI
ncbi:MAG: tyrosine-type recombinase/integrase, partial [Clostridia bacterium]|nr:tyrosine-type recombinase/integrase [Clostridia bacterium]